MFEHAIGETNYPFKTGKISIIKDPKKLSEIIATEQIKIRILFNILNTIN